MPVAIIQSKEGSWVKGGTSFTVNFTSTPTSGNTIVAFLFSGANGSGNVTTTGWSLLDTKSTAALEKVAIWTKIAGGSEPTGVSVGNDAGGDSRALHLYEISGVTDVHGTREDTSPSTITGPTLTPSAAGLILAGFIGRNQTYVGTAVFTPTAPLVADWAVAKDSPGRTHRWSGHLTTTSGSYTPTMVVTAPALTNTAGVAAVAFVAAPVTIPAANFIGTPVTGVGTCTTTFTDLSTNTPTSWAWTFGDGGTSTSQNPIHNYTSPGTYNVSLTATNASGSGSLTRTAYVVVSLAPAPGAG